MRNLPHKIWKFFSSSNFQTVITFVMSGILAGALFTWLTSLPALEDFFFESAPKLPVARFSWWAAFSLFPVLGLIIGFLISPRRTEFVRKFQLTFTRSLLAIVIAVSAIPLCSVFLSTRFIFIDNSFLFLIVPFVFLAVFALAMCLATRSLKLFPVAFLASVIFTVAGSAALFLTFSFLHVQDDNARQLGQWAFLFAALSLNFGCWLLWRATRGKQKAG